MLSRVVRTHAITGLVVVQVCLVWARPAHAYIDPGVVGVLYQSAYAAIFGLLALFVFRPIHAIKAMLRKRRGLPEPDGAAPDAAPRAAEPPADPRGR